MIRSCKPNSFED